MEYGPLYPEIDEIRLLALVDDGSEPIRCTIENVSLRMSPLYKAGSYCWGDANDTKVLVVNGHEVAVTVNLEMR